MWHEHQKDGFGSREGSEIFFVITSRKAGSRVNRLRTEISIYMSSISLAYHEDSVRVPACKGPLLRFIPTDTGKERAISQECPPHKQNIIVHAFLLPKSLFL